MGDDSGDGDVRGHAAITDVDAVADADEGGGVRLGCQIGGSDHGRRDGIDRDLELIRGGRPRCRRRRGLGHDRGRAAEGLPHDPDAPAVGLVLDLRQARLVEKVGELADQVLVHVGFFPGLGHTLLVGGSQHPRRRFQGHLVAEAAEPANQAARGL